LRRRSIGKSPSSKSSGKAAKDEAGMWARPNGDEFYRWALKASTTTSMTPDEVHAMGQSELERLHGGDGHHPEEPRLHHRHGRRRMQALARIAAYQFAEGDKGRRKSWRSSRNA
jgi:uncharacterized protein (DUF885 family)